MFGRDLTGALFPRKRPQLAIQATPSRCSRRRASAFSRRSASAECPHEH